MSDKIRLSKTFILKKISAGIHVWKDACKNILETTGKPKSELSKAGEVVYPAPGEVSASWWVCPASDGGR